MRVWAIAQYEDADRRVKEAVRESYDIFQAFEIAANEGFPRAQFEWGMHLRNAAESPEDLEASAGWLLLAAQAGSSRAMTEYGFALGLGIGVERDATLALIWLQKAQSLGSLRARHVAQMVRAMDVQ